MASGRLVAASAVAAAQPPSVVTATASQRHGSHDQFAAWSARLLAPADTIVTVTKRACVWCGRKFTVRGGPGRPRVYCKPSCKQRDYEARRRADELGLGEHELIVTRGELQALHDRLFLFAYVVEDIERDLVREDLDEEAALAVLLDAAHKCIEGDDPAVSSGSA